MGSLTLDYIPVQPQVSEKYSEVKWGKFQCSLVISWLYRPVVNSQVHDCCIGKCMIGIRLSIVLF